MASRNLSCKESIALYHNLQSRMFVVCTVKYVPVYKNIHTKCVLFPRNLWIRNFVFYVMFKKSFISMIRLFKTPICCPPKCHNSHIDAVMLMKFLSEGVGGSISSRTVLCFHSFCLGCQLMQVLWHNIFLLVKIYCYLT